MKERHPPAQGRLAIEFDDVAAAAERLDGHALRTPVLTHAALDARCGAQIFFKCENLQHGGAFKFRGAFNALSQLPVEQRRRGVVAFSSGNHAIAVALAAKRLAMPATIVMPTDAPEIKARLTAAQGAGIVTYDRFTEDREAIARRLAEEQGLALVPPFDHPAIMAGQGTAALELFEQAGELDLLLVCVGGGGLISGCATAAAGRSPGCRVVGVEPAAGDDVRQSLARGEIVSIEVPRTIADGAQTRAPGRLTFPVIRERVAAIETASDRALVETMRFFAESMKLVVEPTGCLAAAPLVTGALDAQGLRVGVIVSGGNVALPAYIEHLATTLLDSGG
ncbi:MAG: threo-3-hydroxy-L-aspartate ammonia-lyase [Pseudomonadota bacterium]|nr:threo-3-hydroxy-L-aspartate ammonia-lyase [Pseudomonadota bacterium]